MKKNTKLAYGVLAILFILFNVIAFAVPTSKTATFWITYAFTAVAFAAQIGVWKLGFKDDDTLKSKFLGVPIIYVGAVYLITSLIAFAVFMTFPMIAPWIAIIVCALITGISAVCLIGADTARDEIRRVEEKVAQKVFYIRELQVDIKMLAEEETDTEIKSKLMKLAEKIRYSDPMSSEKLTDLEEKIKSKVEEVKTSKNKAAIITELDLLLTERNKKAKLLK
ncbi:MAG: hypothetical protein HFE66_08480 [Clostridiales bacterium]|jgi:hypothetical protein|nr:hypothetical protein [Clostridiales bacterium]